MRDADGEGVVRISQADPGQHASLIGRLRTLSRLGLAEEGRNGRWTLDRELESRLRRMGERGDIIRTLNRALAQAGLHRPDRKSVVSGKSVSVRVDLGGRRSLTKTQIKKQHKDKP